MRLTRVLAATIFALGLAATANATTVSLTVAGTSDPWLAGALPGAAASTGDALPGQAPALVKGLSFSGGNILTFAAGGEVSHATTCPCDGPDGWSGFNFKHDAGAENGISNVTMPLNSLLGVFINDSAPIAGTEPGALNFGPDGLGTDFTSLAPALRQVFFIGNGMTSSMVVQQFMVPNGATRLYLGTMDSWGWFNNMGEFDVDVTLLSQVNALVNPDPIANPEPATLLLLGTGLLAAARLRKKR